MIRKILTAIYVILLAFFVNVLIFDREIHLVLPITFSILALALLYLLHYPIINKYVSILWYRYLVFYTNCNIRKLNESLTIFETDIQTYAKSIDNLYEQKTFYKQKIKQLKK